MNTTLSIATWWQTLGGIEKFFWVIALLFSFLFIVQTILAFVGGGGDDDGAFGDSDEYIDGDSGIDFQFFTIKNFITFFTVFGWVGLGCLKSNLPVGQVILRSEEHTSELQSLMRISYAVFCLQKKKHNTNIQTYITHTRHQQSMI